jgi:Fur family transcriptional regulator, ferric uptake regulator
LNSPNHLFRFGLNYPDLWLKYCLRKMINPKSSFVGYLKSSGLRVTRERIEVFTLVAGIDSHFSAEFLHLELKKSGSKTSRATVYNTLEILRDCGLVTRLPYADTGSRYEKTFDRTKHEHLVCTRCGTVTEFISEKLIDLQMDICRKNNFLARSSRLQVFGLCANCQ